jgi:hypothetical protein
MRPRRWAIGVIRAVKEVDWLGPKGLNALIQPVGQGQVDAIDEAFTRAEARGLLANATLSPIFTSLRAKRNELQAPVARRRGGLGLAVEPGDELAVRGVPGEQDLDGDGLADLLVEGLVHGPHAALPQPPREAVLPADELADLENGMNPRDGILYPARAPGIPRSAPIEQTENPIPRACAGHPPGV